jgi:hypothetical protein
MSAWMVDFEHVNVLVWAGLKPRQDYGYEMTWYWGNPTQAGKLDHTTATEVGEMLVRANVESLRARYGDEDLDHLVDAYEYRRPRFTDWSHAEVLKAINCYEYQACEVPGWRDTQAAIFCDALRGAIIRALPGYETAPWRIDRSTQSWASKQANARALR